MKKWYIYSTKQGTTKKCGEYIKEKEDELILHNIKTGEPKVTKGDSVIVATSFYIGKPNKKISEYIKNNQELIKACNSTLLVCGTVEEDNKDILEKSFQDNLTLFDHVVLGGHAFDLKQLNFMEKQIIKKVANVTENQDHIKYENLDKIMEQISG